MSQTNYIVYTTDKNYWMHLYVSLYSLLSNNNNLQFKVSIFCDDVNQEFEDKVQFLKNLGNISSLEYIIIKSLPFEPVSLIRHFTEACYYRLFMGSLLPKEAKKALYLDSDLIVESSIEDLLKINLEDYVLAAVPDFYSDVLGGRLGFPKERKYFNSGVLLVNLDKWRFMNVEDKFIDYMNKYSEKIRWPDQDVLNEVLINDWKEIDHTYNYQTFRTRKNVSPKIVHFVSSPKPWTYMSTDHFKSRYWHYLKQTPYKGYREPDRNLPNYFNRTRKKALEAKKRFLKAKKRFIKAIKQLFPNWLKVLFRSIRSQFR